MVYSIDIIVRDQHAPGGLLRTHWKNISFLNDMDRAFTEAQRAFEERPDVTRVELFQEGSAIPIWFWDSPREI